jgi:transcriptional regulator with XRE-family HTH domain
MTTVREVLSTGVRTLPNQSDADVDPFSVEVGERLRSIRQMRRLSLGDIERESNGRWSASAIGAYERGFRNLSLPRLRELAEFYQTPMSVLLGEDEWTSDQRDEHQRGKVVLDLVALADTPEARAVHRFARSIVVERRDFNGRVLSIRRDDMRAIASLLDTTAATAMDQLRDWGALVEI